MTKYKYCWLLCILFSLITNISAQDNQHRIKSVSINGNNHFKNKQIVNMMDTKPHTFLQKVTFWRKKPVFYKGELEGDIERIIRNYQRDGFLNIEAEVEQLNYREDRLLVDIRINIRENERVRVADLILKDDKAVIKKEELYLRTGKYFIDSQLRSDLAKMKDSYDREGYPYAEISYQLALSEQEDKVTVKYTVEPGPKAIIGEISFNGLDKTKEKLLRRHILVEEGEFYDRTKLEKTRTALHSTGLFQFVSVGLSLDEKNEITPVGIIVRENDTVTLDFGVGYGIEDRFRVYATINKLRFLGGMRRGTLYAKYSYLEPINLDFKLNQPAFPTINSSISVNPFYREEREPGYRVKRLGSKLAFNHRFSDDISSSLTYGYESNKLGKSSEIPLGSKYKKSSINLGLLRDTSRPQFFQSSGSVLSLSLTYSGADFPYIGLYSEGKIYRSITDVVSVAGKIKTGINKNIRDNAFIPMEDRFYAGGSYSVRGWSRSDLGPKGTDGKPSGGKALLEGGLELRFPLWKDLTGVSFVDCGNVWEDSFAHRINDLRYATGLGLRYATLVGPIRLDVATPIAEGRMRIQFFISLGQAF